MRLDTPSHSHKKRNCTKKLLLVQHRAVVLSPREYHRKTAFVVVCPITTTIKGYPFEVVLPEGLAVVGAVLSDQVKSLDRHVRDIEVVGKVPDAVINEITAKLGALLLE